MALGPAVSGGAYQVHTSVALQVAASLGGATEPDGLDTLRRIGALTGDPEPGRHRLDIRIATAAQLTNEGLRPDQISICPLCTVSEPLLFHSWRRDQVKAVQWSGIVAQGG
jgi:copper oxidase (laccase) domain-containing protein